MSPDFSVPAVNSSRRAPGTGQRFCRALGAFAVALALGVCGTAPASAESIFSFIDTIIVTHPNVHSAEKLLSAAEQDRREAVSAFFPQLSVNAELSHEQRERDTGTTEFTSPNVEFKLTQPIFDGGRRGFKVDATNSLISLAGYEIETRQLRIALDAAGVYLDVLRTAELARLAEANLRRLIDIEEQLKGRAELDTGRSADLTLASKQVLGARIQAIMATAANDLALDIYKVLAGHKPSGLAPVSLERLILPGSADTALEMAMRSHPSIAATTAQIEQQLSLFRQAQSEFAPSLDLELKNKIGQNVSGVPGKTNDFYVGLKLGFTLDAGGGQFARMDASELRMDAAIADEANAHLETKRQVLGAWSRWETTRQILPVQTDQTRQAKANLDNFRAELDAGTRDLSEAFGAEGELFAARQAEISAKYDNLTAAFGLLAAMGTLLN